MKLSELLPHYTDESLSQLAHDKLEDVTQVRLPRTVLEREIATALGSYSYIAEVLAASQPPTYAFLKLLMEAPDFRIAAEGFSEAVTARTNSVTARAEDGTGMPQGKNYRLYLVVLAAAWSSDRRVNSSEAHLLAALRTELGISMREHLQLEHHPEIREYWDTPRAYANARNYLLARGLVLTHEDQFVLPDEVRAQVRRYWGMELHDANYRQLLSHFNIFELRDILDGAGLPLSGSKEERIARIVDGLVPPSVALSMRTLNELKGLARELRLPVALAKDELTEQLIRHFDDATDTEHLRARQDDQELTAAEEQGIAQLLHKFSNNQLYELLAAGGLRRSGTKAERVAALMDSGLDLIALISALPRRDLVSLCRESELPTSGPKDELISRLIEAQFTVDDQESDDEDKVGGLPLPAEVEVAADTAADVPSLSLDDIHGISDIRREYPDFSAAEQAVLALLRDARSLNERDLQRLGVRYGLNWLLPKAHMSELLQKLAARERQPIRIRSTGSANIYEWLEGVVSTPASARKWAARDVIEALRQGVVPERGVETLFIGQDQARAHFGEQLQYIATGRSAFKFVKGAYGSGKTFFLSWLRNHALNRNFAVSTVRVSAEMTMGNLAMLYKAIMDGLRSPEKRGASSIADLLETWLLEIQRRVARIEGLSPEKAADRKPLLRLVHERIREELTDVAAHDPGLATALSAYYDAKVEGRDDVALSALAYIRGDPSVSAASLRQINVRGNLEPEQVLTRLRAILGIVASTRLKGLVILIDELELVRRRPHRQTRDQAYETLRALIDEAGENRMRGCLIVCTGTEELFSDARNGLPSYQALANRVNTPPLADGHRSIRQPVIELDGLNAERLRKVARKAREIHGDAYDWPATERVTDADIDALVNEWTRFGGDRIDRLPRPFLRQLVHVLDLCEENPTLSARESFGGPELDQEASDAVHAAVY